MEQHDGEVDDEHGVDDAVDDGNGVGDDDPVEEEEDGENV